MAGETVCAVLGHHRVEIAREEGEGGWGWD